MKTIEQYKASAPEVPTLCCPIIDDALEDLAFIRVHINATYDSSACGLPTLGSQDLEIALERVTDTLEELRERAAKLRSSGIYWRQVTNRLIGYRDAG